MNNHINPLHISPVYISASEFTVRLLKHRNIVIDPSVFLYEYVFNYNESRFSTFELYSEFFHELKLIPELKLLPIPDTPGNMA